MIKIAIKPVYFSKKPDKPPAKNIPTYKETSINELALPSNFCGTIDWI